MKQRKIGEQFIKKGRLLEIQVAPQNSACVECYYHNRPNKCDEFKCVKQDRKDKTDVIVIDLTETLSPSNQLLLERGLYKP